MKPVKLIMSAFGSYAGTEVIDFTGKDQDTSFFFPGCFSASGQERRHFPHPMQRSRSIFGNKNPSSPSSMEMASAGQALTQAAHPQQRSFEIVRISAIACTCPFTAVLS